MTRFNPTAPSPEPSAPRAALPDATPSIWTVPLTEHQARAVSHALKTQGYRAATTKRCRRSAWAVAHFFEPGDEAARRRLLDIICEAAGLQPSRSARAAT